MRGRWPQTTRQGRVICPSPQAAKALRCWPCRASSFCESAVGWDTASQAITNQSRRRAASCRLSPARPMPPHRPTIGPCRIHLIRTKPRRSSTRVLPALSSLTSMAFAVAVPTLVIFVSTQFMLEGNLTSRPREINLVLLLVVTALLSIPLALNRGEAWDEFNAIFIKAVLMFIVMVNAVRSERRLRALLLLALAVSCFLAVNAIGDYRAGRLNVMGERVAGAVGGMFGNPNDMALHLVTMLPAALR